MSSVAKKAVDQQEKIMMKTMEKMKDKMDRLSGRQKEMISLLEKLFHSDYPNHSQLENNIETRMSEMLDKLVERFESHSQKMICDLVIAINKSMAELDKRIDNIEEKFDEMIQSQQEENLQIDDCTSPGKKRRITQPNDNNDADIEHKMMAKKMLREYHKTMLIDGKCVVSISFAIDIFDIPPGVKMYMCTHCAASCPKKSKMKKHIKRKHLNVASADHVAQDNIIEKSVQVGGGNVPEQQVIEKDAWKIHSKIVTANGKTGDLC